MKELVLFGNGDYAEQAHYYLAKDSPWRVVAFCVTSDRLKSDSFLGLPNRPFETIEADYPASRFAFFAPMSGRRMNRDRRAIFEQAKAKGYRLISYVSSRTILCDNAIGENCFILEGANIQPFVTIGDNTVVWCSSHIGHHSRVGSHVFVSSGVMISGRCQIGEHSYLSGNCVVDANIELAEGTLCGISSVISRNTESWGIYTGQPARKRKVSSAKFEFLR